MKMIRLYIVLFLIVLTTPGRACSFAYQYSLFPIGSSAGSIIVLEVEMTRYVNTPGFEAGIHNPTEEQAASLDVRWKGSMRLSSCFSDYKQLIKSFDRLDFSDLHYSEELKKYLKLALNEVENYPFFIKAEVPEVGYCFYDKECSLFEKEFNDSGWLYLKSLNSKPLRVDYPTVVLKKYEMQTKVQTTSLEQIAKSKRADFGKRWARYSIRKYTIGDQSVLVYTLGWGAKSFRQNGNAEKRIVRANIDEVEEFTEGNVAPYHGQRFDVMQIN